MTNLTRSHTSRQAFTLVELIVVLMILVGLHRRSPDPGRHPDPAITDMVSRTSRSAASSNISEVAGAIQRYEAQYLEYPNNFDSLMEDVATPGVILGSLNTDLAAILDNVTVSAGILAALQNAGISNVGEHANDAGTFALTTSTALAATDILQGLDPASQVQLGLETSALLQPASTSSWV